MVLVVLLSVLLLLFAVFAAGVGAGAGVCRFFVVLVFAPCAWPSRRFLSSPSPMERRTEEVTMGVICMFLVCRSLRQTPHLLSSIWLVSGGNVKTVHRNPSSVSLTTPPRSCGFAGTSQRARATLPQPNECGMRPSSAYTPPQAPRRSPMNNINGCTHIYSCYSLQSAWPGCVVVLVVSVVVCVVVFVVGGVDSFSCALWWAFRVPRR